MISPLNLEEFQRLQRQVQTKQRESERAQGEYDALVKQIKQEFGWTETNALKMLSKEERELQQLEEQGQKALQQFKEKWKEQLDD